MMPTGSRRSEGGSHVPAAERGDTFLACLPRSLRSATLGYWFSSRSNCMLSTNSLEDESYSKALAARADSDPNVEPLLWNLCRPRRHQSVRQRSRALTDARASAFHTSRRPRCDPNGPADGLPSRPRMPRIAHPRTIIERPRPPSLGRTLRLARAGRATLHSRQRVCRGALFGGSLAISWALLRSVSLLGWSDS
jgi:hypothetical protein